MKRIGALFLALLLFCMSCIVTVSAAEETEPGSISVLNMVNNQTVSNTEFRLYHVADVVGSHLEWTEKYADYQLKLDQTDDESFDALPLTLSQYIKRDSDTKKPDAVISTGVDGKAVFGNLNRGVYLITGDSYRSGDYRYDVVPSLVILPYLKNGSSLWQWSAALEMKHESVRVSWPYSPSELSEEPKKTSVHVIKSWNDEGHETERPLSVQVQLMNGNRVEETVTLNSQNNWRYTWTGLDVAAQWYVIEQTVPSSYRVEVEQEGATFHITNYRMPSMTDPDAPQEDESNVPHEVNPKLPQTGQQWLLVIVLSVGGILCALSGAIMLNTKPGKHRSVMAGLVGMGLAYIVLAGGLTIDNIVDDKRADREATAAKQEILQIMTDYQKQFGETDFIPDYKVSETMEMPEALIDGKTYIGTISIPSLKIELPVQTDCTASGLKTSPGRYVGSIYDDDCIIAGHNYKSHFGRLKNAREGDEVVFTDIDGNEFKYQVVKLETIDGYNIDGMKAGEWDLTLFTCTIGGKSRVTLRCSRVEVEA